LNTVRVYDPKSFIVSSDEVDLSKSNTRCRMPCWMVILLTMRCTIHCVYCYADHEGMQGRSEFDLLLYKRLIREAKECGIGSVELLGGDPFCREDIFDIIEYTLSEGMHFNITTKYPLSREDINRLAEMGLSKIRISIDALSPDIIDKMVSSPNHGKKLLKVLDYLGEAGIQVHTHTVLTSYNIHDAINLIRFLVQLPHVYQCSAIPYRKSMFRHDDNNFCSLNDLHEFEREFNQIRHEFPRKILFFQGIPSDHYRGNEEERASVFWKRGICTANRQCLTVLPDGRVTICEQLYFHEDFIIGDLTKQTLREVWNSPRASELAHPEQSAVPDGLCKDCSDFYRCNEVIGRCIVKTIKAYGSDRSHWPDPRCPRAPVGNRLV
jgi:radical SAM protein with 4Fe4S-binding SPASM domain